MKYIENVKGLGFSEEESKIYLSLLKLGVAKVSNLVREVDIPRTSFYGHIQKLIEEGLVKKSNRHGVNYFSPTNPQEILEEKENKVKEFSIVVPQLAKLFDMPNNKAKVEYLDTKNGTLFLYEQIIKMNPKYPLLFVESGKALKTAGDKLGIKFWEKWQKKFLQRKIVARGVSTADVVDYLKSLPKGYREIFSKRAVTVRLIDSKEFPFNTNLYLLYPNTILIDVPHENLFISIENKSVYDMLLVFFELLFRNGERFDLKDIS